MQAYGVDAVLRIMFHLIFIYMAFWSLMSIRVDQFFKKQAQAQIRVLMLLSATVIGYLASSFFQEIIGLFRNIIMPLFP